MAHTRKAVDPKFRHVFNDEHCMPFDVTRAVDEASRIKHPRIWTAERDREMWHSLQAAGYRRSVSGQRRELEHGPNFFQHDEVYNFYLLAQLDHKRPDRINLQQYYLEEFAVKRAGELPNLDLRFKSKVVGVVAGGQGATLQVETPNGIYTLQADWLVVADGARSPIRRMMKLDIEGKVFKDRF